MDLFELQEDTSGMPLAARMRPQTLDEIAGQHHLVGPGSMLRRSIEADRLSSLILYGPPGTGKTTLAQVIAGSTKARFITLNAVTSGVSELRKEIESAREQKLLYGVRTVLFIDEIHRFTKSQQDVLLPHVENGLFILIGATTENPYFEVNAALISRSMIFRLSSLTETDLRSVLNRALEDPLKGLGQYQTQITDQAKDHWIRYCSGDARRLLNALELAVLTTPPDQEGLIHIDLAVAEQTIQERAVVYDKSGDSHYDTISAFIKSIRGSDPDATLFWLAKMLHVGEDPRFILRRLIIHASEDIGNADPRALTVAVSAFQAFETIGMPEGKLAIAQAALYLATAPKSNSVLGILDAMQDVAQGTDVAVPIHLRDAHYAGANQLGHGKGYLYPHDFEGNWAPQSYLPNEKRQANYYRPTENGYEAVIKSRMNAIQERLANHP